MIIKYDTEAAGNFILALDNLARRLDDEMKAFYTNHVREVSTWWTGQDQEAFVNRYNYIQNQIKQQIEEFKEHFNKLIKVVGASKVDNANENARMMSI